MRKILGFVAILITACSNGIDIEERWAYSMSQKYPSSIRSIVLSTLPEEDEYTLSIDLKPENATAFKSIVHDVNEFLRKHSTRKSVLVIDTSRLNNSVVATIFTKAELFRKSLKWIHYNCGAQDIEPGAGVKQIDPTLALINKRNFPNLYSFSVVLAGGKETNAQNLKMLKRAVNADTSNKIDVDVLTLQRSDL